MTLTALRAIERGAAAPNLRALVRLVLALDVPVDLRPVPGTRYNARYLTCMTGFGSDVCV